MQTSYIRRFTKTIIFQIVYIRLQDFDVIFAFLSVEPQKSAKTLSTTSLKSPPFLLHWSNWLFHKSLFPTIYNITILTRYFPLNMYCNRSCFTSSHRYLLPLRMKPDILSSWFRWIYHVSVNILCAGRAYVEGVWVCFHWDCSKITPDIVITVGHKSTNPERIAMQ